MKTFAIVAKPNHPLAESLILDLVKFFKRGGYTYLVDEETYAGYERVFGGEKFQTIPRDDLTTSGNVIIVLGGDGTLISVCRHPGSSSPDIIGVNLGTLGFLTEITADELMPTLEAYQNGATLTEPRPLLEVCVKESGKESKFFALNDVVIGKQALARIFALRLKAGSEDAAIIRGDGVIISTPAGSTAYSLAAGGSIVHPGVDALLVTPICPHSLSSRPLVVPDSMTLEMTIGPDCRADSVFLTVDGQEGFPLHEGASVLVRKSKFSVNFVKSLSRSYFGILTGKLKWGQG
ncbi:MAG TPA: NAD(+)/NADH kinase [Oligoflexia bacterium]|nr:NAD(+)/NADH kinase [Oligoflexia bacterium]HMP48342.1 NAD(+)/NADH kinase [Oligoflexia bacterium]